MENLILGTETVKGLLAALYTAYTGSRYHTYLAKWKGQELPTNNGSFFTSLLSSR